MSTATRVEGLAIDGQIVIASRYPEQQTDRPGDLRYWGWYVSDGSGLSEDQVERCWAQIAELEARS